MPKPGLRLDWLEFGEFDAAATAAITAAATSAAVGWGWTDDADGMDEDGREAREVTRVRAEATAVAGTERNESSSSAVVSFSSTKTNGAGCASTAAASTSRLCCPGIIADALAAGVAG
jgi:hypothetical protein